MENATRAISKAGREYIPCTPLQHYNKRGGRVFCVIVLALEEVVIVVNRRVPARPVLLTMSGMGTIQIK